MTRKETTSEDLLQFCKDLRKLANDLERCANDVSSTPGMNNVLLHKTTMSKKHLPALWEWIVSVAQLFNTYQKGVLNAAMQAASKVSGKLTRARIDKLFETTSRSFPGKDF